VVGDLFGDELDGVCGWRGGRIGSEEELSEDRI